MRRLSSASARTAWTPEGAAGAYLQAALHAFVREWENAALAESAIIEGDEPRVIYRDKIALYGAESRDAAFGALQEQGGAAAARKRRS